ncbi:MAG: hypothetical protein ACOCWG_04935 [bacterium]
MYKVARGSLNIIDKGVTGVSLGIGIGGPEGTKGGIRTSTPKNSIFKLEF